MAISWSYTRRSGSYQFQLTTYPFPKGIPIGAKTHARALERRPVLTCPRCRSESRVSPMVLLRTSRAVMCGRSLYSGLSDWPSDIAHLQQWLVCDPVAALRWLASGMRLPLCRPEPWLASSCLLIPGGPRVDWAEEVCRHGLEVWPAWPWRVSFLLEDLSEPLGLAGAGWSASDRVGDRRYASARMRRRRTSDAATASKRSRAHRSRLRGSAGTDQYRPSSCCSAPLPSREKGDFCTRDAAWLGVNQQRRGAASRPSCERTRVTASPDTQQGVLKRNKVLTSRSDGHGLRKKDTQRNGGNSEKAKLVCMADVSPRPVAWLWQDRIATGRVSLIVGAPGLGKSFVTCDMAARISTGTPWPDGTSCNPGSVILVSSEDDPGDTIRPRLDAHNADVSKVHLLTGTLSVDSATGREVEHMFSLDNISVLEDAICKRPDCRLVVIDPIGSFLGGHTDSYRDNAVRAILAPVARLAEQTGVAMVLVAHRRKSAGGSADESALGSRAFTGLARSVWHLFADGNDPDRRLLLPGKTNLSRRTNGLALRIGGEAMDARISWDNAPVNMTADEALALERSAGGRKQSKIEEAKEWLVDKLGMDARPALDLKNEASACDIAPRTLERAAKELGVATRPDGFRGPWLWQLSGSESPTAARSAKKENGETVETVARLRTEPSSPRLGKVVW